MSGARLYRMAGDFRRVFVRVGTFRPPRKGEFYLSGAIPEAWSAPNDLDTPFYILREATSDEATCPTCHRRREVQS